ncbi:MAG: hypothetical protein LBN05_07405 [Oscillospiraceae bacterium]|jgi:hypothetical protein|nr:hypothetical protein [Oscillospiraceae bacterium]
MKKLLSVLLVMALILLPLAAVVTSAAAVIAVNNVTAIIDQLKTVGATVPVTTTAPPVTEEDTDPPSVSDTTPDVPGEVTSDDTTPPAPGEPTTPVVTKVDDGKTSTKPTDKTTTTTKPNPVGGVPSTPAAVLDLYKAATTKAQSATEVKKNVNTKLTAFAGTANLLKLTGMDLPLGVGNVGEIVKDFLGQQPKEYKQTGKEALIVSSLTANDITGAVAVKDGANTKLTISIKGETNPKYNTSAISHAIPGGEIFVEENVRAEVDQAVKDSLKGLVKVTIGSMTFITKNVKIVAVITADNKFVSLTQSYDFDAALDNVKITLLGSGDHGEMANSHRDVIYSNWKY